MISIPTAVLVLLLASGSGSVVAAAAEEPLIPRACAPPHDDHKFCDATLPLDERLDNLIEQLTLEEKTILLVARESPQGNISRLGIPEYDWGGNCVHGVQSRCTDDGKCPTSFPNPNTLGATFNSTVWKSMGSVIGLELRALWLQGVGENHDSNLPHMGLDCWSPNVGIQRDPRWGRNHETPSEDPFLCGQFGTQYTLGLQNNSQLDSRFLQAVATLKHFDANSLEGNWYPDGTYGEDGPLTRHSVDPTISQYDLHSSYYPAFKASVVEGGAAGVMCSYNAINGVPSCANHDMLHDTLRGEWNFRGYITSDTGAIKDILTDHKYTETWKETVAVALNATCDIQSAVPSTPHHPWETGGEYITYVPEAIEDNLLEEETVNEALRNSLGIRFRLGLFDPIDDQPLWHVKPDVIQSDKHTKIATDATAQGFVLLKDETSLLPLDPSKGLKMAVIGPFAKDHSTMIGDYLGQICPTGWNGINLKGHSKDCVPTFYSGFESVVQEHPTAEITYVKGCDVNGDSKDEFAAAVEAAQNADVVLFMGGLDGTIEIEGLDRPEVGLPQIQVDLLEELAAANPHIILPLLHGGIVGLDDVLEHVPCIISMGNPGRFAAEALAEAVFGMNPRAWGKLPVTWYKSTIVDELNMVDFDMSKSPGRTYRYYTGEPAFPFGHGLNPLTTFDVKLVEGEESAAVFSDHGRTDFTVKVTNTGSRDGDEVVMAYFKPLEGVVPSLEPASKIQKQLFDFQRVSLKPNESTTISFHVGIPKIQLFNRKGKAQTFHGEYEIEFTNGIGATSKISLSTDAPSEPSPAPSLEPTTGKPTTLVEHIVEEEIVDIISGRNIIIVSLVLFAVAMTTTFCILRRIRENPDGLTARVCQRVTCVCCCLCRCLCCRRVQHKHEQLATDYDGVFAMAEAGQDSFDDDGDMEEEDGVIVTREEDEIL